MAEEHVSQSETSAQPRGTVQDKAPKPAGLLPKNTQRLVILAVAVVMVLIMWLAGGGKRASTPATRLPVTALAQPPNAATVQDFKETIEQQQAAARQPISPANLERLRNLGLADDLPPGSVVPPQGAAPEPGGVVGGGGMPAPPPPDPVKEDRKKREYLSLFAPNVAFSYRNGVEKERLAGEHDAGNSLESDTAQSSGAAMNFGAPRTQVDALPTGSAQITLPGKTAAGSDPPKSGTSEPEKVRADSSHPGAFNSYTGKQYVVFEGTVLEALLINRLNGTFAGPVSCLVTTDIYSHDRQQLLIPAGSKILGEAKKVEAIGQQRLAVFFHRLIMPDGYSVSLDQFKGLNQTGETALRDKVNNHYAQIFGASLAVGILGGISEAGSENVLTSSPVDRARAGFGSSLANSSIEILDKFLNILPTVTIREGSRVKVYLSGDLLLPAYTQHTIERDL